MPKAPQQEDFPMTEAPPAYFAPVVAQPTAFQQPENYPGPYAQPMGVPSAGVYQGQFEQPAAYPNTAAYPGQNAYNQPSFGQMGHASQDNMEIFLAAHEKLSFHSNQKISCGNGTLTVQIRGSQNQLVMSTVMTSVTTGSSHGDNSHSHRTSTIAFNDPTGRNLMTSKQATTDCTVTAGDRFLGVIKGVSIGCGTCCASDFSALTSNGEMWFETVKRDLEIAFIVSGVTIATAKKGVVNGDEFGVEFTPSLAPHTKAMVVATAYYLYFLYFAETSCGCSGALALARFFFLIPLAPLLIFIIFVSIMSSRF